VTAIGAGPVAVVAQEADDAGRTIPVMWYATNRDLILREHLETIDVPLTELRRIEGSPVEDGAPTEAVEPVEEDQPREPNASDAAGEQTDSGAEGRNHIESVPPGGVAAELGRSPDWPALAPRLSAAAPLAEDGFVAVVVTEQSRREGRPVVSGETRWLLHRWNVLGVQNIRYDRAGRPAAISWHPLPFPPDVPAAGADGDEEPETVRPAEVNPYSERYRYDREGTLRSVRRCEATGCVDIRYAGTAREMIAGPDWSLRMEFDRQWQPTSIVRTYADGRREEETRRYQDGGLVESTVRTEGMTTRREYRQGRMVLMEQVEAGYVARRETREYDEEGRLERKVIESRRTTREERYGYGQDGTVTVTVFEDDRIVRSEARQEDGVTVMTEYYQGEPAIRVYSQNGIRYREEVLVDGEVVRTREYE
jgi:hypothetical protein